MLGKIVNPKFYSKYEGEIETFFQKNKRPRSFITNRHELQRKFKEVSLGRRNMI